MLTSTPKPKACGYCGSTFTPMRPLAVVCSPICAIRLGKAKKEDQKKADKARKEKLKTRREWANDAQKAVNAFVRTRDAGLPCISCGRMHEGEWHAGHFRTRGAAPHLALDPRNVHRQCAPCNLYQHGNVSAYRLGLLERYGVAYVEAIESDCEPRHYSIDELRAIRADFMAQTKQLKKEQ